MPFAPATPCKHIGCPQLTHDRYCADHAPLHPRYVRPEDSRPSPHKRGYDAEWRKIRAEVLVRHHIPKAQWGAYDIDHNPPYNRLIESDHRKYELIPRLRSDHSRKTATQDGGFGNRKAVTP
jgi:5-methylcytosine-specific restriction protein A